MGRKKKTEEFEINSENADEVIGGVIEKIKGAQDIDEKLKILEDGPKEEGDGKDPFITRPRWELFCRYFTQNEELFGNATHAYAEAYGFDFESIPDDDAVYEQVYNEKTKEYENGDLISHSSRWKAENVCAANAVKLLRKAQIQKRLTVLLNELMTDEVVDSQLMKVVMQDHKMDAKISAIKAYNDLKGRIVKKTELTGLNGGPIQIDDNTRSKTKSALGRFLSGNRKDS